VVALARYDFYLRPIIPNVFGANHTFVDGPSITLLVSREEVVQIVLLSSGCCLGGGLLRLYQLMILVLLHGDASMLEL
jgi:hypothetical protein